MTTDLWLILFVSVLWIVAASISMNVAYWNGVRDGWKSNSNRRDPLWRRQRTHVRETLWEERDMIEESR